MAVDVTPTASVGNAGHSPFHTGDRVRSHTATREPFRLAWTPAAPGPPLVASVGPHIGPQIRKDWMAYDRLKDAARWRRSPKLTEGGTRGR